MNLVNTHWLTTDLFDELVPLVLPSAGVFLSISPKEKSVKKKKKVSLKVGGRFGCERAEKLSQLMFHTRRPRGGDEPRKYLKTVASHTRLVLFGVKGI